MSPAVAACAACGHVFSAQEALGPCPECGGTERTLKRETVVMDRSDPKTTVRLRRVEERRPDGSTEVVEEVADEFEGSKGREQGSGAE
jgi:predicted  nucleic acid-binding Zn-ribbon protein